LVSHAASEEAWERDRLGDSQHGYRLENRGAGAVASGAVPLATAPAQRLRWV